jgi:hypothetical protein
MSRKLLLPFFLLLISMPLGVNAQNPALTNERAPDFITYFDIGVGSTGAEVGISSRVRPHLTTALFANAFWKDSSPFYTLDSQVVAGFKAKYYQNSSPSSLFVGPLIAAHTFGSGFRPLFGITAGFDHYDRFLLFNDERKIRLGIELQGGVDTEGDGFIGLGVRFGIGFRGDNRPFGDH